MGEGERVGREGHQTLDKHLQHKSCKAKITLENQEGAKWK